MTSKKTDIEEPCTDRTVFVSIIEEIIFAHGWRRMRGTESANQNYYETVWRGAYIDIEINDNCLVIVNHNYDSKTSPRSVIDYGDPEFLNKLNYFCFNKTIEGHNANRSA